MEDNRTVHDMIYDTAIYDMIIAGAGPAGSELAYRMAKAGFNVLVLEKDILGREKPCGGGIPAKEIAEFGDIPKKFLERAITKGRLISPGNNVLGINLKIGRTCGATVKRGIYDSYLQKRAEDAGALFIERCRVRGVKQKTGLVLVKASEGTGSRIYRARLFADASGYPCGIKGITRKLNDEDVVATCHVWMKIPSISRRFGSCIEMYFGKDVVPKGYAWIFPKKDSVSVGIGATQRAIKSEGLSLKKLLRDFIRKHPVASKKLEGGRIMKGAGGLIPIALLPKLYSGRIVFVGDAGGFANPIHAGGIYQARKSSAIAAGCCSRFLKAGDDDGRARAMESYDAGARGLFQSSWSKWDLKMRRFFWDDELLESAMKKAMKDKRARDAFSMLISMLHSHEKAYNILESGMLDIIHSKTAEKMERYRKLAGKGLALFDKNNALDRLAMHTFFGDAKRLRMSLILLACDIFRGNLKKAAGLAPVYELLHTASLVHDDIMDNTKVRRGRRTLHILHGTDKAILAGDFLIAKTYGVFSKGMYRLSERQKLAILSATGKAATACCYGQLMDIELAEKKRYGCIKDYLKMVGLKTGSMIEGAMRKGAVIADAPQKDVDAMGRIGSNLGIAFQIIDDSIDLLGSNRSKSLQNDIRQGKITPMLVYALKSCGKKERKFLLGSVGKELSSKNLGKVLQLYRQSGAIEYGQRLSGEYVEKARIDIQKLKGKNSTDKKALAVLEGVVDVMGYWGMMGE